MEYIAVVVVDDDNHMIKKAMGSWYLGAGTTCDAVVVVAVVDENLVFVPAR